jgi:imidazolonepropionase-like amidohydrolase
MNTRLILTLAAAAALAAAQNVTVIQGGTVHTVTKGTFVGSIVIRDNKITEVGEKVMVPSGAKVVDAAGKHVIPGMIDAHSHIASDATNEGSLSITSMVSAGDVINPESKSIYQAMAGGCTTSLILHGSANSIGGTNQLLKMRWGQNADGLVFQGAPPTLKLALGENPKRAGSSSNQLSALLGQSGGRYPATRMGVEDVIRGAFTEARDYQAKWKEYDAKKARGQAALPPRRDLELEPLVEVLEGKRLIHAHCYRADEILMILRLGQEFGFKIPVLVHALEAYKVAKEVAAAGSTVTTFSDWWSYKMEAADSIPYNAALLREKGVLVSLNSDDAGGADLSRRLNLEAAKVLKYGGVPENDALAMVTINPARQLGIDKQVGSIEVGKDADIVIYDKNPLSIYSKVEKVFIDGRQYFDRDLDITGRPQLEAQKKGLIEKEREIEKKNAAAQMQQRRPQ